MSSIDQAVKKRSRSVDELTRTFRLNRSTCLRKETLWLSTCVQFTCVVNSWSNNNFPPKKRKRRSLTLRSSFTETLLLRKRTKKIGFLRVLFFARRSLSIATKSRLTQAEHFRGESERGEWVKRTKKPNIFDSTGLSQSVLLASSRPGSWDATTDWV